MKTSSSPCGAAIRHDSFVIRFEPLSPRTNAILGALVSGGDWLALAKALCKV